jgi:DNA-binding protein HU-beta
MGTENMNKQNVIEIMLLASGITQREAKLALNAFTYAVQAKRYKIMAR